MKKRWIIPCALLLLLLLLVIPIPTGTYKDGGTREYTSLTYKIVDWNYMIADGVYDKVKVYPFPMNFLSIDSLLAREEKNFKTTEPIESTAINTETDGSENHTPSDVKLNLDFDAQYIRTNGGKIGTVYPIIRVISSEAELKNYYEAYKDNYDLESRADIASDSTIGFTDACKRYDDEYFSSQSLVLIVHEEISGSIRHKVDSVSRSESGEVFIDMSSDIPEAMTCDMAIWHILIEIEAKAQIPDSSDITVSLDGKTITENTATVLCERGEASISLQIPCGWEYEQIESVDSSYFGIDFWPEGHAENRISLCYYTDFFGVCGTGLSTERIKLGSYEAEVGRYDGDKSWSFIRFTDAPGEYVATRFGGSLEWLYERESDYEDEILEILKSAVLGSSPMTIVNE